MFKRLPDADEARALAPVSIAFDGRKVECREGDSVAAAMFEDGSVNCRDSTVSAAPRGPYCMMGICYDCLVTIDGNPNQQACMTLVRAGMAVERQLGARVVDV